MCYSCEKKSPKQSLRKSGVNENPYWMQIFKFLFKFMLKYKCSTYDPSLPNGFKNNHTFFWDEFLFWDSMESQAEAFSAFKSSKEFSNQLMFSSSLSGMKNTSQDWRIKSSWWIWIFRQWNVNLSRSLTLINFYWTLKGFKSSFLKSWNGPKKKRSRKIFQFFTKKFNKNFLSSNSPKISEKKKSLKSS